MHVDDGAHRAERLLLVSASPQLTCHGEKENVNLQFDSFVFSWFQNAAKSRILLHIRDLQVEFLLMVDHMLFGFFF